MPRNRVLAVADISEHTTAIRIIRHSGTIETIEDKADKKIRLSRLWCHAKVYQGKDGSALHESFRSNGLGAKRVWM